MQFTTALQCFWSFSSLFWFKAHKCIVLITPIIIFSRSRQLFSSKDSFSQSLGYYFLKYPQSKVTFWTLCLKARPLKVVVRYFTNTIMVSALLPKECVPKTP